MKKEKLQNLLKRLKDLESSLPLDETKTYLDGLLEKETKNFQSSFKENETVKYLTEFNSKLEKFKKDFDLEPIVSEIEMMQEQFAQMQESTMGQFEQNSKSSELTKAELTDLIQKSKGELEGMTRNEISSLLKKVSALEEELSFQDSNSQIQGQSLKQVIAGYEKKIDDLTSKFKESGMSHSAMMSGMDSKLEVQKIIVSDLTADVEKFRKDFMSRLSNIGGGSMNQQINVNSSVMSTKYADVNFKNGGGVEWTASDDNTYKRVNIVASVISGGGGATNPAGSNTQIQYNDGGSFGASSTLAWNKNSSVLTVGNSTNSSVLSVNGPSSVMTFNGNVGIGTTGPGAQLQVNVGASGTMGLIVQGASGQTSDLLSVQAFGGTPLFTVASNGALVVNGGITHTGTLNNNGAVWGNGLVVGSGYRNVYNAPTDGAIIQGNVGIGTTGPGAKLDVNGVVRTIDGTSGGGVYFDTAANFWRISQTVTGSTGKLQISQNGVADVMTLQGNGNVGIGTTNPGAKLEVGLQGSVAGTIRTAGTTGGYVQIQPASVAGNWTFTLPPDDGSAGQILTTDGNGITTWTAAGATGITRTVQSTAVSSTIGGVASTDYVVFATAGVQLTLPTAISNTNQYTIKNMSASSVLIGTTAGQAIDGSATALMPTQYESLSLISNNSVWGVI